MLLFICISFVLLCSFTATLSTRATANDSLENSISPREYKHTKIQVLFFVIILFIFCFLTAFRSHDIGNDTRNYVGYFKSIASFGINKNFDIEIGYQYFCLIVSKISSNPQAILVAVSLFCYIGCGIYIYKYSDNLLFSAVLLFTSVFPFFIGGLRQSMAMVICLYAYQALKVNKKLLFIVLVLIAATFHTSAIITLLLLFHKLFPKKPGIFIPLGVVFILLSASGIIDNLLIAILGDYGNYFDSINAEQGWLGITYYCLRNFVFLLIAYIAYKNSIKKNSLALSTFVLLFLMLCLGFAVNLFERASLYFLLITVVELPNVFFRGNFKNKKTLSFILCFVMLAFLIVVLEIRPHWYRLTPFEFCWS